MSDILGTYKGCNIPAILKFPDRGGTYRFFGIAHEDVDGVALAQLADDEVVVSPGLIYREVARQALTTDAPVKAER